MRRAAALVAVVREEDVVGLRRHPVGARELRGRDHVVNVLDQKPRRIGGVVAPAEVGAGVAPALDRVDVLGRGLAPRQHAALDKGVRRWPVRPRDPRPRLLGVVLLPARLLGSLGAHFFPLAVKRRIYRGQDGLGQVSRGAGVESFTRAHRRGVATWAPSCSFALASMSWRISASSL